AVEQPPERRGARGVPVGAGERGVRDDRLVRVALEGHAVADLEAAALGPGGEVTGATATGRRRRRRVPRRGRWASGRRRRRRCAATAAGAVVAPLLPLAGELVGPVTLAPPVRGVLDTVEVDLGAADVGGGRVPGRTRARRGGGGRHG